MKNIILVDYDPPRDWEFQRAIEKSTSEKWETIRYVSNKYHGGKIQQLIRYLMYFWLPFKIFVKRKEYKKVLAWQQFYGLILAFYCRFFKIKKAPKIIVMTFIYKPKKGKVGKIYEKFMRYVITSGFIDKLIVFSDSEKQFYANHFKVSEKLFISEKLGIEDEYSRFLKYIEKGNTYISAGRSNRDYQFIQKNWPEDEKKIEIICDTGDFQNTSNIEYITDCHDDKYLKKLAQACAVIVPLKDTKISSGQLVILQGMMFGKPVIVTKNETVCDYVIDKEDGFIIEKTGDELLKALDRICDTKEYMRISNNARKKFLDKFSLYSMGIRIGRYV